MQIKRLPLFCLLLASLFIANPAAWGQQIGDIVVITAPNEPLPSLEAAIASTGPPVILFNEIPNFDFKEDTRAQGGGNALEQDPLLQTFDPSVPTAVLTQFDGADNTDNGVNVTPPDTDGDVSSDAVDRYVQMINIVTAVFDKTGALVPVTPPATNPFFSNVFWTGMGGICETTNRGDPIVLYDETTDRWLVSQFAFTSTSVPPWSQCVAISTTSNPLGAYNRYEFSFSALGFPDYPKHGIVTDDVTLFAHMFNPNFIGSFLGTIDKAAMYAGTAATLTGTIVAQGGFVAGDLDDPDGTAGDVGAFFARANTAGSFEVWEVVPDYGTPANTTIGIVETIASAPFDTDLCPAFRERCVPHPGTGDDLETLSGRLMHRLAIRDFGSHLSMVTAQTVDAGSGRAGVRWYEVRSTDSGANWTLHQEGTHAPADGLHRWMPSIAINAAGEIGLGYMVSDATTPVEIRVVGQTAASSGTGTFDGDELECRGGVAGSDWSGRAGDYSAMNVDPDTDTFWHTNEFGRTTSLRGWGTAVCEFQLITGPVTRFVDTAGSDATNNCLNDAFPCATVAHAVDEASAGDTIDVAAGTYLEPGLVITKALSILGAGVIIR